MPHTKIRVPVQKRSIEKKHRIVKAASTAFAQSGYFPVTIPQIAKRAGISTGTVYAYFHDKRDILLICMQQFRDERLADFTEKLHQLETTNDLRQTVRDILGILVDAHDQYSRKYHDDLMSLKYSDAEIGAFLDSTIAVLTEAILDKLKAHGYVLRHPREQSMLASMLVDAVQNELSWPQLPEVDYDREIVIEDTADIILSMVKRADMKQTEMKRTDSAE
ncbi:MULTISPECIES: TetR/AcrR family transcriptional regulator [Bifidobacterium]|jgi:AcrR family transcriptional regulator|uniref:TetR/AcrR family transcriptional regulator n=1 Tax=Bifidobacterium tibiigranuli TaxID=2172043 RepID=A0A5N6S553_9BIFI|nr:TetR/AcrR family transcriptional regulator [Bifidobacterium tibiigranuli]KAE8128103.1 TetR/AcrR family transcriptional regulator [Bifidobacterium tibiigranuli]KAE8128264.1 hypothetical protein DDF78_06700 [Bifidobacterium tibiigranuli]MCH3973991.1 TetR/AcrR family transcriptional regulator [Bifidobacterium tibiigranuli]MCH4189795.1 TetR/AcrR family transcriptional regulator [Bifidobacterium tibiigranuli]MCH4203981.1 TetR/AcrR family transcriptional regulator [Bifidobacterium tibiigranuli]